MRIKEFWNLLDGTSLNDTTVAHEENDNVIEDLSNKLKEIIPEKLYRYKSFDSNNYNIDALEKNEIWASSLSEMNDYFEYDPYWNPNSVLKELKNSFEDVKSLNFNTLAEDFPGFRETYGSRVNLDFLKEKEIKQIIVKLNEIIFKEIKNIIDILIQKPEIISDRVKETMDTTYVSCFSEKGCSNIMAGLYSDNAKGFILEYNTKELLSHCNRTNCSNSWACTTLHQSPVLIPVNYQSKRYDISQMLTSKIYQMALMKVKNNTTYDTNTIIPFNIDYLFPLKLAGRKQSTWRYEQEWRLVYFCNKESKIAQSKHIPLQCAIPSAIILCPRCSKESREIIINIANKKLIPVYELVKKYNSRNYDYIRKPINNAQTNTTT